jgi:hypothetical protein
MIEHNGVWRAMAYGDMITDKTHGDSSSTNGITSTAYAHMENTFKTQPADIYNLTFTVA